VVKLDKNGKTSVVYSDTHTGARSPSTRRKRVFVVQRGLREAVMQLAPQRKVLANSYQGQPLDCFGGLNDLTADSKGGVYFTMGGVYYANPKGEVTKYGENVGPNGIVLSADEKRLYVTNGPALAAFDVQPDGSLTNQREFARLEGGGNGDGSTIDAAGRIYVTTNPGVQVIQPGRQVPGPHPHAARRHLTAFAARTRKRCSSGARCHRRRRAPKVANAAQVWSIPMLAQGYKRRAK
jgi:gluconolactonase